MPHPRLLGMFRRLDQLLSASYRKRPIITRDDLYSNPPGDIDVHIFDEQETITLHDVPRLHPLPGQMKASLKTYEFPPPFVAHIHDGTIRGRHAAVMTKHNHIVLESVLNRESVIENTSFGRIHYPKSAGHLWRQIKKSRHYQIVCPMLNAWSRNYYHWILENLIRLYYVEQYTRITGYKPLLLIEPDPPAWMLASLQLLGYSADQYVTWDATCATAEHIIVPILAYESGFPSPVACRWLSKQTNAHLSNSTPAFETPYIYVSRRRTTARRVVNEDQVMAYLEPLGFHLYELETLTFEEQVRLFSQAEFIIAPHGAGLANCLHARPQAALIEMFEPSFFNACFFRMAQGLGFHYRNFIGESRGIDQRRGGFDIYVDVEQLKQLVEPLLVTFSNDLR